MYQVFEVGRMGMRILGEVGLCLLVLVSVFGFRIIEKLRNI